MKHSLITLAAAGTVMAVTPASAQQTVQVEYKDLNLTTAEGQKTLERRITRAAKKICGYNKAKTGTRIIPVETHNCVAKARKSGAAQMASIIDDRSLGG